MRVRSDGTFRLPCRSFLLLDSTCISEAVKGRKIEV